MCCRHRQVLHAAFLQGLMHCKRCQAWHSPSSYMRNPEVAQPGERVHAHAQCAAHGRPRIDRVARRERRAQCTRQPLAAQDLHHDR